MSMSRTWDVGRPLGRPVGSVIGRAIGRVSGVAADPAADPAADVRALFSANGGDFTGTMLDFTKETRLFSDYEGTAAGDGDTLALVVSDETASPTDISGSLNEAASWTAYTNNTVEQDGDEIKITYVDDSLGAVFDLNQATGLSEDLVAGAVYKLTGKARVNSGSAVQLQRATSLTSNFLLNVTATTSVDFTSYFVSDSGELFRPTSMQTGEIIWLSDLKLEKVAGTGAYQNTAAERPSVTTDAFGTLIASADGVDDNLNLPDGVMGDGTQHIHIFSAFSNVATGAVGFLVLGRTAGNYGLSFRKGVAEYFDTFITDGSGAGLSRLEYERPLTDNETVVGMIATAPTSAGDHYGRLNGAEVFRQAVPYSAIDDPGAPYLFGFGSANSIEASCHGIVVLTGSRAMTSDEIATVETWLASLANDPLLTAEADTVLQRLFTPATDLNYTSDWSAGFDGWTDVGDGDSTVTVDTANGELDLTVPTSGVAKAARSFPVRVGYAYRLTYTNAAGSDGATSFRVGYSANGLELGSGSAAIGATETLDFVPAEPLVWVTALTGQVGETDSIAEVEIDEIAATGTYYDLLDETKMYSDLEGTLVEAEGAIQLALPSRTADIYSADLNDTGNTAGAWTAYGTNTVEQDGDEVKITYVDDDRGAFVYLDNKLSVDGILTETAPDNSYLRIDVEVRTNTGSLLIDGLSTGPDVTIDQTTATALVGFRDTGAVRPFIRFDSLSPGQSVWIRFTNVRKVTGYPLQQPTAASRPVLDATGTFIEFDGVDDYFEAVDPEEDLAIVGDLTVLSAINVDDLVTNYYFVASGDPVNTSRDMAYQLGTFNATGALLVRQADAVGVEFETSTAAVTAGVGAVTSTRREGAGVLQAVDVTDVGAGDTFSTVTTPTAGTAPETQVGNSVGTGYFLGSIKQLLIADRALSTGLLLHLERAITEKIA